MLLLWQLPTRPLLPIWQPWPRNLWRLLLKPDLVFWLFAVLAKPVRRLEMRPRSQAKPNPLSNRVAGPFCNLNFAPLLMALQTTQLQHQ